MWVPVLLAAGLMGYALKTEGEDAPFVLDSQTQRAGFKPSAMARSMQRGRPHDPRAVTGVEVTLGAKTAAALESRAAFETAKTKARETMPGASWARRVSGIYRSRRFDGFEARFEVS
jgi:hypothetical protein